VGVISGVGAILFFAATVAIVFVPW